MLRFPAPCTSVVLFSFFALYLLTLFPVSDCSFLWDVAGPAVLRFIGLQMSAQSQQQQQLGFGIPMAPSPTQSVFSLVHPRSH